MNTSNISTKTKTMILVLFLFAVLSFVFTYLRYFEILEKQDSLQQNDIKNIKNLIDKSIKDTSYFYLNRALANLNSQGVLNALENEDAITLISLSKTRFDVLKKENAYLKSMFFISKKLEKIAFLGENLRLDFKIHNGDFYGFFVSGDNLYFLVNANAIKNGENLGSLMFVVDAKFILSVFNTSKVIDGKIILDSSKIAQNRTLKPYIFDLLTLNKKAKIYLTYDNTKNDSELLNVIYSNFFIVVTLFILVFFILNYGFNVLIKRLELANEQLKESENLLQHTNQNLEDKIKQEIAIRMAKESENLEKERILIHQSKLASMGEMIGNIAHQWKQPLTELNAIFIKLGFLNEVKKLEKQDIDNELEKCEKLVVFMSKTIDDFRHFFVKDKFKEHYCINEYIKNSLKLITSALKHNGIKCKVISQEEVFVIGYPREFAQVILNILSNAKDALVQRGIQNPQITIKIFEKDNKAHIEIQDNAGGIETCPVQKVFEPYFTTKHASNGTGIGLYMSKIIIEKNAQGILAVRNYQNGAIFEIIL
ncbi:PAS/PAC sensor signal transduction histidine kinase [Campylobacter geochelonis]|nr:PAS/PAC sensor signal transduction histidine kinase [Campylobacter geochelonis]